MTDKNMLVHLSKITPHMALCISFTLMEYRTGDGHDYEPMTPMEAAFAPQDELKAACLNHIKKRRLTKTTPAVYNKDYVVLCRLLGIELVNSAES